MSGPLVANESAARRGGWGRRSHTIVSYASCSLSWPRVPCVPCERYRFKDTGGSRDTQDTHGTRGRTKAHGPHRRTSQPSKPTNNTQSARQRDDRSRGRTLPVPVTRQTRPPVCVPAPPGVFLPVRPCVCARGCVNVNTTDATTGATRHCGVLQLVGFGRL